MGNILPSSPNKDELQAPLQIMQLKGAKIEHHWAGFRPASKSDVVVAKHAQLERLYINTGHFRNGLNMAPESANRIKNLIC
jgi:glycine oxidase